ncbi:hypothetical protein [Oleidesulfovibrio sp.]|uniref:hypothetical protein n=1 Tax=Oleidesulfovibrio sp. TaxID=2909707 RepID=UPI003A878979
MQHKQALLRDAARRLGKNGKVFTNRMLFIALQAQNEPEKARIRRQAQSLVKTGELQRTAPGEYRYNPAAAPARNAQVIMQMWRALHSMNPGFSTQDLARISGAKYNYALKYVRPLEAAGYLSVYRRKGNTILYKTTEKLRNQRNTFYPPKPISDPFEEESQSAYDMLGLFLLRDPYQPAVRQKIVGHCKTILTRFEREEASDDQ